MSEKLYYNSIDELPIYNWFKISEKRDLSYLVKGSGKVDQKTLEGVWELIYSEFLDTFGIPEKMIEVLEAKRDIEVLRLEITLTNDRSLNTFLKIRQEELSELTKPEQSTGNNLSKVYIEKWVGFKLDEKATTVKEYYTYAQAYKEEMQRKQVTIKSENNV